jgi:hypothetical protein
MINDALKTLKLDRSAGPEDIRKAYVRLVRRFPPEHFPEKFVVVHDAYRLLSLESGAMERMVDRFRSIDHPLEVAAILWGDSDELKRNVEIDWDEIENLFKTNSRLDELQSILENVDTSLIVWRK